MTKKTKPTKHGGERPGAGRKRRTTAVKKTVLIEKASVKILIDFSKRINEGRKGYLGHGIDVAALIIQEAEHGNKT